MSKEQGNVTEVMYFIGILFMLVVMAIILVASATEDNNKQTEKQKTERTNKLWKNK